MNHKVMMWLINFFDVVKTVIDSRNFENKVLEAYIRDWPAEEKAKDC